MKKNEEIIYNIIKKHFIVIILIPILAVGGYFGYVKTQGASVYTTSSLLLINNVQTAGSDTPTDRFYAVTFAVADLAKSSAVLDEAVKQLGNVTATDIASMMKVEARSYALTVKIDFSSAKEDNVLDVSRVVTKELAKYANGVYSNDANTQVVKVVDGGNGVTKKSAALSKVKLIGVGGIAFIVTLFAVLSLNWKKESR